jgi:hypothetical protein
MSIELQRYQQTDAVAPYQPHQPEPGGVVALREWAESARAAHAVAESLVQTSFVPEAFRNKPHEATAAILSGAEVGLSPMASLRSFDIISGTAAPRALALRAIVQSRGHEIWEVETTATRAIVRGRRAGSEQVQESVWNIDRAKGLGLLGKHNWKAQPKTMLIARATAECCRLVAADAILGVPYAFEELDDGTPEAGERRTAQRRTTRAKATVDRPAAAPNPAPELEGPPLPGEEDEDSATPAVTRAQLTKIHAQLGDLKVTERADKLTTVGLIVRRTLESSNDLTKNEASALIEKLDDVLAATEPLREFDLLLSAFEDDDSAPEAGGEQS